MIVPIKDLAGDFAEDKELAAVLREDIRRQILEGKEVVVDFSGVDLTTQSFVHVLISDILRRQGESALDLISFKDCAESVKSVIRMVVGYSLDTAEEIGADEAEPARSCSPTPG